MLQVEKIITDAAGPDATLIHSGRSRQDIHSTLNAAQLRTEVLDFATALSSARARLLELAAQNVDTLVPAYARKCFLFLDGKLTRLPTEPWADQARYIVGASPAGFDEFVRATSVPATTLTLPPE